MEFFVQVWKPLENQEGGYAQSAAEVLRITDETLEAFFQLPIPMHPAVLPDLIIGLDKYLQYYVSKAKSGCGKFAHDLDHIFFYMMDEVLNS